MYCVFVWERHTDSHLRVQYVGDASHKDSFCRLATFADARYQAIHTQRSSREWLTSKAVMEKKKLQVEALQSQIKGASTQQVILRA